MSYKNQTGITIRQETKERLAHAIDKHKDFKCWDDFLLYIAELLEQENEKQNEKQKV